MTTTTSRLQQQPFRSMHRHQQQSSGLGGLQPRRGQQVERVRINQADEGRDEHRRRARRAEY